MKKEMTCLDCGCVFHVPEKEVMTCYCERCGSGHLKFVVVVSKNKDQQSLFPEAMKQ